MTVEEVIELEQTYQEWKADLSNDTLRKSWVEARQKCTHRFTDGTAVPSVPINEYWAICKACRVIYLSHSSG